MTVKKFVVCLAPAGDPAPIPFADQVRRWRRRDTLRSQTTLTPAEQTELRELDQWAEAVHARVQERQRQKELRKQRTTADESADRELDSLRYPTPEHRARRGREIALREQNSKV